MESNTHDIIHGIADIQAVHKVFIMAYANQMNKINHNKMNKKRKSKEILKPETIKITDSGPTPWGLQEINDHFLSPSMSTESHTTSIVYAQNDETPTDEKDVDDIKIDDIDNDKKERDLENMIDQRSLPRSPIDQPGGNVHGDGSPMTEKSDATMVQSPMTERSDSDEMAKTLSIFDITFWYPSDVKAFLISIGSGGYVQTFEENEINGECMDLLTERTLKSWNVSLAHCDNILAKRDWYKSWFVFFFFICLK